MKTLITTGWTANFILFTRLKERSEETVLCAQTGRQHDTALLFTVKPALMNLLYIRESVLNDTIQWRGSKLHKDHESFANIQCIFLIYTDVGTVSVYYVLYVSFVDGTYKFIRANKLYQKTLVGLYFLQCFM